jgi:glycerol-3-phosphate dehydrogenase
MAINNSRSAFHKIKSLEVAGGFLDGMKIEFDDNLNCLIGGKGMDEIEEFAMRFTEYENKYFRIERPA